MKALISQDATQCVKMLDKLYDEIFDMPVIAEKNAPGMQIGRAISPILYEIECAIWEYEAADGGKPQYGDVGFRAAIKIFMSALMDKMWEVQEYDKMCIEDRIKMAESAGNEVSVIVKKYTGIDSRSLYDDGL